MLKHTNQDLCKQVEGLQISRMNEVEEIAYLRWLNSCLRDELRSFSNATSDKLSTPTSVDKRRESMCFTPFKIDDEDSDDLATKRLYLVKKFKKWPITDEDLQQMKYKDNLVSCNWDDQQTSGRRHSISGINCSQEDLVLNKKRQSDSFMCSKESDKRAEVLVSQKYDLEISNMPHALSNCQELCRVTASLDVEKRALRIPNPPPRPSSSDLTGLKEEISVPNLAPAVPPPPPPPPPPPAPKSMAKVSNGMVQRAPQVVEFYHSLMKRESRKDCLNSGSVDASDVANVRSSMIGEIENRSSHLLAVSACFL